MLCLNVNSLLNIRPGIVFGLVSGVVFPSNHVGSQQMSLLFAAGHGDPDYTQTNHCVGWSIALLVKALAGPANLVTFDASKLARLWVCFVYEHTCVSVSVWEYVYLFFFGGAGGCICACVSVHAFSLPLPSSIAGKPERVCKF